MRIPSNRFFISAGSFICLVLVSLLSLRCTKETTFRTFTLSGKAETGARTASRAALSLGRVQIMAPFYSGWQRYGNPPKSDLPNQATTGTDGTYAMLVDYDLFLTLSADTTVYAAVSDKEGTFTMISPISADLVSENAKVTININPATTMAGLSFCPSGKRPASADTYCFPGTSASSRRSKRSNSDTEKFITEFQGVFDPDPEFDTLPPDWETMLGIALARGQALSQLIAISLSLDIDPLAITVPKVKGAVVRPAGFISDNMTNAKEGSGEEAPSGSGGSSCSSGHSMKDCGNGSSKCCFNSWLCCQNVLDGVTDCNPASFCD